MPGKRNSMKQASAPEIMAFEMFAEVYPHEAAEADWSQFVAYTRKRVGWEMSEEAICEILAKTAEKER